MVLALIGWERQRNSILSRSNIASFFPNIFQISAKNYREEMIVFLFLLIIAPQELYNISRISTTCHFNIALFTQILRFKCTYTNSERCDGSPRLKIQQNLRVKILVFAKNQFKVSRNLSKILLSLHKIASFHQKTTENWPIPKNSSVQWLFS